jgi:AcrR family transcriptional regulator
LGGDKVKVEKKKPYSMELRAAAAEATHERILSAAAGAFLEHWYDDVTIAAVAKRAGVSGQTVLNHFGSKEALAAAAHRRIGEQIESLRYTPEPGDVPALVEATVDDYERTGDAVIRMLALEEKVPALQPLLEIGRQSHRRWVESMFRAPELVAELMVATDVYAWKHLRRDQRLSREDTLAAMRRMVEALLEWRTR